MHSPKMKVLVPVILALAAATAWGLAVSIGVGTETLERSELPDSAALGSGTSETVAAAAWGPAKGQLGVDYDGEARGPASFGVDDRGRVYVLDQIKERVVRFDGGRVDAVFRLPDAGFDDMAVARDRFAVLSRHEDRRVLLFDAEEGLVATLPVAPGVPDIMRVHIADGEVIVECPGPDRIAYHVLGTIAGESASADEQTAESRDGLPVPDGRTLRARKVDPHHAAIDVVGATGSASTRLRPHSTRAIGAVIDVFGDARGNVIVVYGLAPDDPEPDAEGRLVIARYDRDGELVGTAEAGDRYTPEPHRKVALSESGDVYQLVTDASGARVVRWSLAR